MSDNKKWQLHPKVRVSKDSIGRAGTLAAGTGGGLLEAGGIGMMNEMMLGMMMVM